MDLAQTVDRLSLDHGNWIAAIRRGDAERTDLSSLAVARWMPSFTKNPGGSASEARVEAWALRRGIWLDAYGANTATMGAYLHPETKTEDHLDAANKFYQISWYIDDTAGNDLQKHLTADQRLASERTMRALSVAMDGGEVGGDEPVVVATRDLMRDLARLADPAWTRRFVEIVRGFLKDTATDHNESFSKGEFSVERYLSVRNNVSTMPSPVALAEFASGFYVHPEDLDPWTRARVEAAQEAIADLGSLLNDLFSFEKEMIGHREGFNVIPLIAAANECGLDAAIVQAMNATDAAFRRFLDARSSILGEAPEDSRLRPYMRQLDLVTAACWHWQLDTGRYERATSVFVQTDAAWRRRRGSCGY